MGISHTKAKGDYEWRNSVGADESDGYLSESVSKNPLILLMQLVLLLIRGAICL